MSASFSSLPFGLRHSRKEVEEALAFAPKFDGGGLITVVTVDAGSRDVLMVAYMNEEALRLTIEKGEAVYWSRSRQEIWHKGATSGQIQVVKEIRTDCDQDALVLLVEQTGGGCCHTGRPLCFYRRLATDQERNQSPLAEQEGEVMPLLPAIR